MAQKKVSSKQVEAKTKKDPSTQQQKTLNFTLERPAIVYYVEERGYTLSRSLCEEIVTMLPRLLKEARASTACNAHAVVINIEAWRVERAKAWFQKLLPKDSKWVVDVYAANYGDIRLTHPL